MLSYTIESKEDHLVFPALVQPKLDGMRCIAVVREGKAFIYSRAGNRITCLPHIVDELENSYQNIILDGELYNHRFKDNFNKLISRTKRAEAHPDYKSVQYHVYDRVMKGDYRSRIQGLIYGEYIVSTESIEVLDRSDLDLKFAEYIKQGYEGAMYRNPSMEYEHKRSTSLLKIKQWFDSEYEIVDIIEGRGKLKEHAGAILFKHESGTTFKAKPSGEYSLLKDYFKNKDSYIGKKMTVKYQNLTPSGVPRFGNALRLRHDI